MKCYADGNIVPVRMVLGCNVGNGLGSAHGKWSEKLWRLL